MFAHQKPYKLLALISRQKKVKRTIAELQQIWKTALDQACVERHLAKNLALLGELEDEIKHLENQQAWR